MLLPWTFFSQCLAYSVESIVGNGELLKKVRVAKLVFPRCGGSFEYHKFCTFFDSVDAC